MHFTMSMIDHDILHNRAMLEAEQIFDKDSTRRGRSLQEIYEITKYGQAAEVYLMQYHNFVNDTRKYKDVIDPNNNSVEVKVTEGTYYVNYVLARCVKAKLEPFRNYPSIVYIFIGNKVSQEYYLHGIYVWNGKSFVLKEYYGKQ